MTSFNRLSHTDWTTLRATKYNYRHSLHLEPRVDGKTDGLPKDTLFLARGSLGRDGYARIDRILELPENTLREFCAPGDLANEAPRLSFQSFQHLLAAVGIVDNFQQLYFARKEISQTECTRTCGTSKVQGLSNMEQQNESIPSTALPLNVQGAVGRYPKPGDLTFSHSLAAESEPLAIPKERKTDNMWKTQPVPARGWLPDNWSAERISELLGNVSIVPKQYDTYSPAGRSSRERRLMPKNLHKIRRTIRPATLTGITQLQGENPMSPATQQLPESGHTSESVLGMCWLRDYLKNIGCYMYTTGQKRKVQETDSTDQE